MARRRARSSAVDHVPGYENLVEIGRGAFATVYQATEVDTRRDVALKILKVDTVHPHLVDTFNHEIQAMAKVSDHPNIVTLYRPLTTPDGRPVLVLELCRESLSDRIRRGGPLGARDTTRIGIKIGGALETAHRAGFLHRDLNPQNILVTQFAEPALGDFGVAALQASAQATAGVFGFTTLHAAPEVLEGHHLSPATDVYGLASTMYQALTGLAPFATFENEAPASVILRIIRDPVRPIRSHDIPNDLSELLEAALAKDPSSRPATAAAFAAGLMTVEQANGWPATPFVAWGEARPVRDAPGPVAATGSEPADAAPPEGLPSPPAPPHPYQSRPSVRVADVAHTRPRFEPAARPPPERQPSPAPGPQSARPHAPSSEPPSAPGPRSTRPPAPSSERPPAPPPPWRQADPAPRADATAPPSLPPWQALPPPPGPQRGPGLADPGESWRQVVAPGRTERGPRQPVPQRPAPLAPLHPPEGQAASARPQFVDPPADGLSSGPAGGTARRPGSLTPESPYEQTILPTGRVLSAHRHPEEASRPKRGLDRVRLVWTAAIGVAALVVLASVLLIAGVL